jgi:hypothetical protein
MTGEELFLNELNFHIRQGISKKDLTDLINERIKQLTLTDVSSMFSAEQMEQAFNDGVKAEKDRCGEFDIENYC